MAPVCKTQDVVFFNSSSGDYDEFFESFASLMLDDVDLPPKNSATSPI